MSSAPQASPELAALRARLDEVDRQLIELAAQRQALVGEIGRIKHGQGKQVRDFARERQVLEQAAAHARRVGLPEALAQDLLKSLIEASLASQEAERVRVSGSGDGRAALVIGGGGRMGRWFARFLDAQGYAVQVADPAGSADDFPVLSDWRAASQRAELVVLAAPLRASAAILDELRARPPRGVVFDIGSLKAPLRAGLAALRAAGVAVCSVHPMFGPTVNVLAGRHVILVDLGDARALSAARTLFEGTLASVVTMGLDQHDRLMAWVLGLSHALNIAFFSALARSGLSAAELAAISSTTFDRQLALARQVASENPHLYYEIQRLNPHGPDGLRALQVALAELIEQVGADREDAFVATMRRGAEYLRGLDAERRT